MSVSSQAIRMLEIVADMRGRKEREIPVLGHVPIKRVEGVEENEEKPENRIKIALTEARGGGWKTRIGD